MTKSQISPLARRLKWITFAPPAANSAEDRTESANAPLLFLIVLFLNYLAAVATRLEDPGQRYDSAQGGRIVIRSNHVVTNLPIDLILVSKQFELFTKSAADWYCPAL